MEQIHGWIEEFDTPTAEDYLKFTGEVVNWISAFEHEDDAGIYWDVLPGKETNPKDTLTSITSLYGGSAGIALFFLRLFQATGEASYLDKARKGIDFSIANNDGKEAYKDRGEGTLKGIPAGFYNGPSGTAYVSYLLYEETREQKYLDYALAAAEDLIASASKDEEGAFWSGTFGVLSDGGLVLFLLWLYEKTSDQRYLDQADLAGQKSVAQAEEDGDKAKWMAMDSVAFGLGKKGYFPGFFYGTAGTGYILAKLYKANQNSRYLELARKAANYLADIADVTPNKKAALIRYNDPYVKKMHYLGMCQGPIGHSRLFYELYTITGEESYKDWILKLTDGILAAGAPYKHSKGFWHTYSYCCGGAAMVEHFIEIYQLTKDEKYKQAARDSVDALIRDSNLDGGKRRWYTAWNRHAPSEVEAWTGLYQGSAGCASAILFYYNFLTGRKNLAGYLEDPYNR